MSRSSFTDHDDAWIRELFQNASGFLPDGKTFYFTSEKTGYMHLYAVDTSAANTEVKALTEGAWEINDVARSAVVATIYPDWSPPNPFLMDFRESVVQRLRAEAEKDLEGHRVARIESWGEPKEEDLDDGT